MKKSLIILLFISVSVCFWGCNYGSESEKNISNEDIKNNIDEIIINDNLGLATIDEIVAQCHDYQGKKINNMQFPDRISISEKARFFSFNSHMEKYKVDSKELLESVYGDEYSQDRFAQTEISENDYYDKKEEGLIVHTNTVDFLNFSIVMPMDYQLAVNGVATETMNYVDKKIEGLLLDKYEKKLDTIAKLTNCTEGYTYDYNGWVDNYSIEYENHVIDYSYVDIKYYDIPFNTFIFCNDNGYYDQKKDVFRFGLGRSNYISFIDENDIGTVQLIKYAEPQNIVEYKKILSFDNAVDILVNKFDSRVKFVFDKVELVYVGETNNYHWVEGEMEMESQYDTMCFHPFWIFLTSKETSMTSGCNGHSGFFIDALSGEISTYTEPVEN